MATILIVDDNKYFLDIACALVSLHGHECLRAESKSEALQIILQRAPDCYILDIRLEESLYGQKKPDGLDLFEEIKARASNRRVIFTSAHSDFEEEYLQRRGATRLIDKARFATEIGGALKEVFYPRVLLVENNQTFAFLASAQFEARGMKCVLITDVESMRSQVEQCDFSTFDAIVTDAVLSKLEGYNGWDIMNQVPVSYSRDLMFFVTGKTKSEIECHIEEATGFETREELLASVGRVTKNNVLDKQTPSWADVVARACAVKESANG